MTIYKTKIETELWTKIGSSTGLKPPVDTLLEISGPYWLRERDLQCWLIAAPSTDLSYPSTWVGKCVEQAACELMPPMPTNNIPETLEMRDVILVALDATGAIIGEYITVGTVTLRRIVE